MGNRTIRTPKKRQLIIDALTRGLSVTAACDHAGIGRTALHDWKHADPEFAAEMELAIDSGTDRLEDIAHHRAEQSSDTLMIFLLKARRRDKYGDTQRLEHTGKDGAPLMISFSERPDGPA